MSDWPYSKGFMNFGCLEPSKKVLDFWNFLLVDKRLTQFVSVPPYEILVLLTNFIFFSPKRGYSLYMSIITAKCKKNNTFVYAGKKNSKVSLKTIQTASARLRVFTSMFVRCNFLKQFEPSLNAMTHWIDPKTGPRDQTDGIIFCNDDSSL